MINGWLLKLLRIFAELSQQGFGVRKPGESFKACVERVGGSYSLAGFQDWLEGTDVQHTLAGELFLGNDIFSAAGLFGVGPESGIGVTPVSVIESAAHGMGTPTTLGGNGPNRIERLFIRRGRPPQALLRSKGARQTINAFKFARRALVAKSAVDAGLAGAALGRCALVAK